MPCTHCAWRISNAPHNYPTIDFFSGGLTIMPKNYYIILGIPSDSTQADIKAAYRRLAKKFHPDHYNESPTPFQGIQEAYSVLSDPKSRKSYDSSLQSKVRINHPVDVEPMQQYNTEQKIEPLVDERRSRPVKELSVKTSIHHPWATFDTIFDGFLGNFTEQLHSVQSRHQNTTIEVTISPEQARRGGNVRIMVPIERVCPSCFRSGNSRFHACLRCNGAGILRRDKPLLIRYPPGITRNHSIELSLERTMDRPLHVVVVFTVRR